MPQPSILELSRYRNFLRLQAKGISPHYRARLEASDIVQQTLLEAHQKIGQFRGRSEPEMAKWLSQMLRHNIADAVRALRRKKRDISRERPLQTQSPSGSFCAGDWLSADQTTPSLCASNSEQLLILSAAIEKLPSAQQEVIVLHHLQGKTLAEVAAQVDKTTSSVAGLLYRGLKTLRESMAG